MATEFSEAANKAGSANPLRISNVFHLALGSINLLVGGLIAFLLTREIQERGAMSLPIMLVSAVLMALGLGLIARAWREEKFRVQPDELGPFAVPGTGQGTQKEHEYVCDVLNNGVKPDPVPDNALLSKLYNVLPGLEHAPRLIRWHAETQAFRIVHLMVAAVGFILAWIFAQPHVFALMVPVYLYLTINPMAVLRDLAAGFGGRQQMDRPKPPRPYRAIFVLLFSVFAPIVLGMVPAEEVPVPPYPVNGLLLATIIGIVAMLISSTLFVASLKAQTRGLTTSGVGHLIRKDVLVPSIRTGLIDSLIKELPHPRRVLAYNAGWQQNGEFGGQFLVEAERKLNGTSDDGSVLQALSAAWNDAGQRPMVALSAFGMLSGIAATLLVFMLTRTGAPGVGLTALCLFSVSTFSLAASRGLWNRLDFRSVLYRLYYRGSYSTGKRVSGNAVTGEGSYTEEAVRIEHVEFEVCVANVSSVTFHRDAPRQIESVDLDRAKSEAQFDRIQGFYAHVVTRVDDAYRKEGAVRKLVQGSAALPKPEAVPPEVLLSHQDGEAGAE